MRGAAAEGLSGESGWQPCCPAAPDQIQKHTIDQVEKRSARAAVVHSFPKERAAQKIDPFIYFSGLAERSHPGGDLFLKEQPLCQSAEFQGFFFQFFSPLRPVGAKDSRPQP